MSNPYKIPPTTGPTTKKQIRQAKIKENYFIKKLMLLSGPVLIGLFVLTIVVLSLLSLFSNKDNRPGYWYLVECPGDEAWISTYVSSSNGRLQAELEEDLVYLPSNCKVTRKNKKIEK